MKQKKRDLFFVILPIGFETEFVQEMNEVWHLMLDLDGQPTVSPMPEMIIEKGGVSFKTELHLGLQVNIFSKLASRVLLRIADFFVRESYEFERELKKIKIPNEFLNNGFQLKVSCSSSQLNNEKKVASIVTKNFAVKEDSKHQLFIRIFENHCHISLDTSGEHLHRRGLLVKRGDAPLRENIAHFAIRKLIHHHSIGELNKIVLFDPAMGSGTLIAEGHSCFQIPERSFAFQSWSITPALMKTPLFLKNYKHSQKSPFAKLIGNDIDEKHFLMARDNLAKIDHIQLINCDLFNLVLTQLNVEENQKIWVLCNPPYGLRVKGFSMAQFFNKMSELQVQRMVLIYPKVKPEDLVGTGFELIEQWPIENGGLKIHLTLVEKI